MRTFHKADILSRIYKEIVFQKSLMMQIDYIELDAKEWEEFLKAAEKEYPRFGKGSDRTFCPEVKDEYEAFYAGVNIHSPEFKFNKLNQPLPR